MSTAQQQKAQDSNDAMTPDNNDVNAGAGGTGGGDGGGGGGNDDSYLTGEKGAAKAGGSEAEAGVIAMETETGSSPDAQQQPPPPQPPAPAPAPTIQQPGTIPYARWPDDAPFKLESKVMSVIVGHTSIHWAIHEGSDHQFIPTLFWNTPQVDMDIIMEEEEPQCEVLERHIAKQAQQFIFGDSDEPDIYNISLAAAQRISPAISVYVISENPEQDKAILYMFEKVPARIFKLRTTDFFPEQAGVFPSMSADLAAGMLAARALFGGRPTLVLDGDKAITFAAMDSSSRIIGGGVAAGLSIRFRSLADTVSGMPRVKFGDFKEVIQQAKEEGGLPTFAFDTKTAMISTACSELSTYLRNLVKRFVCTTDDNSKHNYLEDGGDDDKEEQRFNVVVSGWDGKFLHELLEEDASGIVPVDPGLVLPPNVDLNFKKNLSRYGIGKILDVKCIDRNEMFPENDLLYRIVGARVAKGWPAPDENNDFNRRGLVLYCNKKESVDEHEFCIRYDEDGSKEIWSLVDIYDGLLVYGEIGEKPTKGKDVDWVTERKAKSAVILEDILQSSAKVRQRKEELAPHFVEGKIANYLSRNAEETYEAKLKQYAAEQEEKRKEPPRKRPKTDKRDNVDPSSFIGARVAKYFPIEDPTDPDKMRDELFFGTVTKVTHRRFNWFKIKYDDGDEEEFNLNQLNLGLKLYEKFKDVDPYVRSGGIKEKPVAEDVLKDYEREKVADDVVVMD